MSLLNLANYRLLTRLGGGGSADVYVAEDSRLHRKVALKVLHQKLIRDEEQVRRFQQEAQLLALLNHPNVLTIHDVGEVEGTHFIALELVEGRTLRERLAVGALPLNEALSIACDVARALGAAHEVWIVHRDIKPENIMIRRDGQVKVLDFGVAKINVLAGSPLTQPRMVLGTIQYLSPEQIRCEGVDPRTDVWGLGVVLFEMIAGSPPFQAANIAELIEAVFRTDPPLVSHFVPEIPARVDSIVSRMLRRNPDERHTSAAELLAELREFQRELDFGAMQQRMHRAG